MISRPERVLERGPCPVPQVTVAGQAESTGLLKPARSQPGVSD